MALFNKVVRKFVKVANEAEEKEEAAKLPQAQAAKAVGLQPLATSLTEDLEEGSAKARHKLETQQAHLLKSLDLAQYAVNSDEQAWADVGTENKKSIPTIVSVRNAKRIADEEEPSNKHKHKKKRQKTKE